MDVAIVHDFLSQTGGAERVVLEFSRTFPEAPIYTSLYDEGGTFPEFRELDVRTTELQGRVDPSDFRRAVLRYPSAFASLDLEGHDLVIVSTSAFAHHVRHPNTFVYWHTPPRYLYRPETYAKSRLGVSSLRLAFAWQRPADRAAARRHRRGAANSSLTRARLERHYGITLPVLHPPLGLGHLPEALEPPGTAGALVVARLLPYKRVDLAIDACRLAGVSLTVVGTGPEEPALRARAGDGVEFVGRVDDATLARLFVEHAVVLVPGQEDFGYLPVEAAYAGRPVVASVHGGAVDSVDPGRTGLLLRSDDPADWARALRTALDRNWSLPELRDHAMTFHADSFRARLRGLVDAA